MTSGTYRNAYPTPAASQSPTRRFPGLRTRLLRARGCAEIAPRDPGGEAGERERGDGEHDREHAAEGPVAGLEELLLDHVADQAVLGAAQDVGNGEDAERGNEHQRPARVHARQREREGD